MYERGLCCSLRRASCVQYSSRCKMYASSSHKAALARDIYQMRIWIQRGKESHGMSRGIEEDPVSFCIGKDSNVVLQLERTKSKQEMHCLS